MVIDVSGYSDYYNEASLKDAANKIIDIADLWKQWSAHTKDFVKHKYVYKQIDEDQKSILENHYDILKDKNTTYSKYKKSFDYICKFVGIPNDTVILETISFKKDTIAVRYSKGKVKVTIPDGIKLIHVHTTSDDTKIDSLIPAFRSKIDGKYMYPTKRCYFTCVKSISTRKCGLEGQKTYKLTPKDPIKYAYIDPACTEFRSNSVYVETERPIPVKLF